MNHKGIFRNNKYASRKVFSMRQHYGRPLLKASHRRMAYKKTAGTVQIDVEYYLKLLNDRFNEIEPTSWGGDHGLRKELFDFIRDNDGMLIGEPSIVADNFAVNGEIVYREWFSKDGEYSDLYEEYNGDWRNFCESEGIIYNDEVCCINLGF